MKSEAIVLTKGKKGPKAFEPSWVECSTPGDDQLQIESEAFGLNYADVMASLGLYREAPPRPCVIGYEVVGQVKAVGKNVSTDWIGKRVLAFTRFGGYQRNLNIEKFAFTEVGDEPAEELLALCTQGVTAYYMTDYLAPVRAHDVVLVHAAAGGVGSLLIQLCKRKGAKVIAKIGSRNKQTLVENLGADHTVVYTEEKPYEEQIKAHLGKIKISVSYNPVAGATFKKDLRLLGAGGKLFLFGGSDLSNGKWGILSALNFLRKMGRPLPIALMMKSKSIIGVNMLKIADHYPDVMKECLDQVYALYRNKELKVQQGGKFKAAQIQEAHALLASGKSVGKIAVFWD
jgi:NADPH:quinone reductase-like Zn-dependent oxidoreductase